jgi:hypothetical protein
MSITSTHANRLRQHIEKMFASSADWEMKYDLIFDYGSRYIQPLIEDLGLRLEYYDPDTTYQEDVTAYMEDLRKLRIRMGDIV